VIDQAKETVARLQREEDLRREVEHLPQTLIGTAPADLVEQWRARADRLTAAREAAQAELAALKQQPSFDWGSFDQRIDAAIARQRVLMAEALHEQIAELLDQEFRETMRAARNEICQLRLEIARLNSETAELRALVGERSGRL
jgi:chromosome segregation ATPase